MSARHRGGSARSPRAFLPGLLGTLMCLLALPAEAGVNVWTTHGPPGTVKRLAAAPVDPRTIYAASLSDLGVGSSLFKSVNGGESWEGSRSSLCLSPK